MPLTNSAKFIAFEGIDGAGKSSLIKVLYKKLSELNIHTHITAEPTNHHIGKIIRQIFSREIEGDERTIAALFLADRVEHLTHSKHGILQYLRDNIHVISDRYYLSSYAYHVPHVSLDWVIEANSICANLKRPDITFFIDISVEESLKRITSSRKDLEIYETKERITQVRNNYFQAIERVKKDENIVIINGERNIQDVAEDIWYHLQGTIV
jgi:dTMP kinase